MIRIGLATALAVALIGAGASTAQALSTPEEEYTGEYRQSWALLIGVNKTPGLPSLSGVGDAEKMSVALQKIGFPQKNIKILRDPTVEAIRHQLYYAFPQMKKNDRYLVFFSGHGQESRRSDGIPEGYLLAGNTDQHSLFTTAFPMNELKAVGVRVAAKHVLFILDACFSGLAIQKGDKARAAPAEVKPWLRHNVVQIFAAGTGDQKAYQVANQGVFTKWVIEGLRFLPEVEPTRALTFTRLADWVKQEVARESEGRLDPQPERSVGIGEFVLRMPTEDVRPVPPKARDALPTATPPMEPPSIARVPPTMLSPKSSLSPALVYQDTGPCPGTFDVLTSDQKSVGAMLDPIIPPSPTGSARRTPSGAVISRAVDGPTALLRYAPPRGFWGVDTIQVPIATADGARAMNEVRIEVRKDLYSPQSCASYAEASLPGPAELPTPNSFVGALVYYDAGPCGVVFDVLTDDQKLRGGSMDPRFPLFALTATSSTRGGLAGKTQNNESALLKYVPKTGFWGRDSVKVPVVGRGGQRATNEIYIDVRPELYRPGCSEYSP